MELPVRVQRFSRSDAQRVRDLLAAHAGVESDGYRRDHLLAVLGERVRATVTTGIRDYLERAERCEAERDRLVAALCGSRGEFFREPAHFATLREFAHLRRMRTMRVWSIGTAGGEEAYSAAFALADCVDVRVFGTDICAEPLLTASSGIYDSATPGLTNAQREAFFTLDDGEPGRMHVRETYRRSVGFARANLIDASWPFGRGDVDAILVRGVLTHLRPEAARHALERFAAILGRDGVLITGHAESLFTAHDLFVSLGHTVYRSARAA